MTAYCLHNLTAATSPSILERSKTGNGGGLGMGVVWEGGGVCVLSEVEVLRVMLYLDESL